MLTFLVGSKQAFEISLADVAQTQLQGKNDVFMEFHLDDTTGANEVVYAHRLHQHAKHWCILFSPENVVEFDSSWLFNILYIFLLQYMTI